MDTMLRTVSRTETLSEQIYQELRRSLMVGALPRHQKMTIRSLAQHLGTSPTPVREAVARLVSERALAMGANRSIYVPSVPVKTLVEIGIVRHALESTAANAAVAQPSEPRMAALRQCLERAREAASARDRPGMVAAYVDLHLQIYVSSRAPVLINLIERVWVQIAYYLSDVFGDPALAAEALARHTPMVEALAAEDSEALGEAVRDCIDWQMDHAKQVARRETANGAVSEAMPEPLDDIPTLDRPHGVAGL